MKWKEIDRNCTRFESAPEEDGRPIGSDGGDWSNQSPRTSVNFL